MSTDDHKAPVKFRRVIQCPACDGGVVTLGSNGRIVRVSLTENAKATATMILGKGESIGPCPTCKGIKMVIARIEVWQP